LEWVTLAVDLLHAARQTADGQPALLFAHAVRQPIFEDISTLQP